MDQVDGHMIGRKTGMDRKLEMMSAPPQNIGALHGRQLTKQQKKEPWYIHQCMLVTTWGKCCSAWCPGIQKSKAKRRHAYDTNYRCKEFSATLGFNIYLFHTIKNGEVVSCHVLYHKRNHNKRFLLDKWAGG
jgi:hypothetical protein